MRSKAASGVRIPASPPFASVAQLDRVLGYEPSGRRFESSRMHHISRMVELGTKYHRVSKNYCASVAQLDRVLGYEPSGRRFESSRMHHSLSLASLAKQASSKNSNASVAQLDRVLGYEPSGRRFESSRMHHLRETRFGGFFAFQHLAILSPPSSFAPDRAQHIPL